MVVDDSDGEEVSEIGGTPIVILVEVGDNEVIEFLELGDVAAVTVDPNGIPQPWQTGVEEDGLAGRGDNEGRSAALDIDPVNPEGLDPGRESGS